MDNPSIGSEQFITLEGEPCETMGRRVRVITRPRVSGVALKRGGKRSGAFTLVSTVDVADASTAIAKEADYKKLQGTLVTLTMDNGQAYSDVAVLSVKAQGLPRHMTMVVGGINGGDWIVRAAWQLLHTKIP